jgi:hypothetical protein
MTALKYLPFHQVNVDEFLRVLNEQALRTHLIAHPYFDSLSLQVWMAEKAAIDQLAGYLIRAVMVDDQLAGWCGIQPDEEGVELAIVMTQNFWGKGIPVFKQLMCWADELGHTEIVFHLLDSRPRYQALNKMASKVKKTQRLGHGFTSYYLPVVSSCESAIARN